jgi:hypothetical protein
VNFGVRRTRTTWLFEVRRRSRENEGARRAFEEKRRGGERCGGNGDGEEATARRRVAVEVEPNGAMWEAGAGE